MTSDIEVSEDTKSGKKGELSLPQHVVGPETVQSWQWPAAFGAVRTVPFGDEEAVNELHSPYATVAAHIGALSAPLEEDGDHVDLFEKFLRSSQREVLEALDVDFDNGAPERKDRKKIVRENCVHVVCLFLKGERSQVNNKRFCTRNRYSVGALRVGRRSYEL